MTSSTLMANVSSLSCTEIEDHICPLAKSLSGESFDCDPFDCEEAPPIFEFDYLNLTTIIFLGGVVLWLLIMIISCALTGTTVFNKFYMGLACWWLFIFITLTSTLYFSFWKQSILLSLSGHCISLIQAVYVYFYYFLYKKNRYIKYVNFNVNKMLNIILSIFAIISGTSAAGFLCIAYSPPFRTIARSFINNVLFHDSFLLCTMIAMCANHLYRCFSMENNNDVSRFVFWGLYVEIFGEIPIAMLCVWRLLSELCCCGFQKPTDTVNISVSVIFKTLMDPETVKPNVRRILKNNGYSKLYNALEEFDICYEFLWYTVEYNSDCINVEHINYAEKNKSALRIMLCVDWCHDTDSELSKEDEIFNVEYYLLKSFRNIKLFEKIVAIYDKKYEELESIEVEVSNKNIVSFFDAKYDRFKTNIEESIVYDDDYVHTYESLYAFSCFDIAVHIYQYILNDDKYRKYCIAIAQTLIDDFLYGNGQTTIGIIANEKSRNTTAVKYLETLLGTYMDTYMISKMAPVLKESISASTEVKWLIGKIWRFPFSQIVDKFTETEIDGLWIIDNLDNTLFVDTLRDITGMNATDIENIYKFILRYNIPVMNQEIKQQLIDNINLNISSHFDSNHIYDIINDENNAFDINYEELAFRLMNHEDISALTAKLSKLVHHIIIDNKDKQQHSGTNYNIISKFYQVISSTFSSLFLQNWWCSNCWYYNRICKIGNKILDPFKDELMLSCIVCGLDKLDSIQQTLRNKINHRHLLNDYQKTDDSNNCIDSSDINKCDYAHKLLPFITIYSENKYRDYVDILSQLDGNNFKLKILSKSIEDIQNKNDKNRLYKILNIDENSVSDDIQMDGSLMVHLSKEDFVQMIVDRNNKISILSIEYLYDNILFICTDYVKSECTKTFSISYDEIINCWQHIIQIHLDSDIENTYNFFASNINECNDSCSMLRNMRQRAQRDRTRPTQQKTNATDNDEKYSDNYNTNTAHHTHNDEYYKNVFDDIHNFIYHSDNKAIRKQNTFEVTLKYNGECNKDNNDDNDDHDDNGDAEEPEDNDEHLVSNAVRDDLIQNVKEQKNDIDDDNDDDDNYNDHQRYMSDVDSYGFGLIYSYELMSPFSGNNCLKIELLNTEYIDEEIWIRSLNKAFNKYKLIYKKQRYIAKRQSDDYNIHRGDLLMVPHILCIIFYTGFSAFCTEYRSTFRKIEKELNEDLTRSRHSKYYFFSRFLYECIEFYGDVMCNDQIVYHGLNQPFFFQHFLSHFNAPISTTPDWNIARNFSKDDGIILALKVGNNTNDNRDDIVAEFKSNQARYIDVSWISAFSHERELLFFGRSIIFEIMKIYHKEIPNNTLKQLNLLQRIVKNKSAIWNEIQQKRIRILSKRLHNTRNINMQWVQYQYKKDDIKKNIEYESNKLKTTMVEYMNANQFKQFALNVLNGWILSDDDKKTAVAQIFEDYLTINNLSGKLYLDLPRKVLVNWMMTKLSHHNIKKGIVAKCCNLLKKEIQKYNEEILQIIENTQKEATKQFDIKYYLKLYNYYCASQRNFVCIQRPFQLPHYLKAALFSKNVDVNDIDILLHIEKYKHDDDETEINSVNTKIDRKINLLSLSKLTDLFCNAEKLIFSYLSYGEMVKYCSKFCESVIEYVNDSENNDHKRLKIIIFKSMDLEDSKYSPNLNRIIKQYQSNAPNITMSYTFELEMTHTFTFKLQEYH